ncbi:hypothetical protein IMY05_010G0190800 [Salix suchowensis]|nr:hypothetical protein IMY05_010G0190800 [Salix suchowensis]
MQFTGDLSSKAMRHKKRYIGSTIENDGLPLVKERRASRITTKQGISESKTKAEEPLNEQKCKPAETFDLENYGYQPAGPFAFLIIKDRLPLSISAASAQS